ncbi:hypothetical protein [Saccharothrix algeriensis]|uniref:Uncharacterized protein n=1 Tax=Saccharothrix algeriensis TaxID=173560 RepID=A0A8T8HWJ2_9PSEU|nr:hypothetical protein [Saccharothrix algeriensis]MBM7813693.1 hypothetical protein [Saccharothrix algeriensis]QTR02164.1 hypothetical protein J7S33_23605 [Saccharothrix algeriensis]
MSEQRRDWRKAALFAVMVGALALTVNGEVRAVAPMLGVGFGVVLALVFAVSTLLALHYVIDGTGPVRRWAWAVLLFAGGMELGLNTWHAVTSIAVDGHGKPLLVDGGTVPALPLGAAVAVGAGPVLLAGLLSHLVSLAMNATSAAPVPAPVPLSQPAPVQYSAERAHGPVDFGTGLSGTEHRTALAVGTAASDDDQAHPAPDGIDLPQDEPTGTAEHSSAEGTDSEQNQDPREVWGVELWDRAVRTARDYHERHDSHVRVNDIQDLGIGRNRAVALRRDVLAHLLSHPAA